MEDLEIYGLDKAQTKALTKQLKELFETVQLLLKKVKREIDKALRSLLAELKAAASEVDTLLRDAFTVDSAAKLKEGAAIYGRTLALSLYGIQQDLEHLRAAIIRAASPIAALFVPVVKQAIAVLTGLANSIYKVLSALLGGTDALTQFAGSANAAVSAGTALKRSLAGFDEINRLDGGSGTSSGLSGWVGALDSTLEPHLAAIVEKIRQLLAPLQQIDLSHLAAAFERLKTALEPIKKALFAGLEWAWEHIFVPLAEWTAEKLLPAFLETLTTLLQSLNRIITELQPVFTWFWEQFLQPLAQWTGDAILSGLKQFSDYLQGVGSWLNGNQGPVDTFISSVKEAVSSLTDMNAVAVTWNRLAPLMSAATGVLSGAAAFMGSQVGNSTAKMQGLSMLLQQLARDFAGVGKTGTDVWTQICNAWGDADSWMQTDVTDPMVLGIRNTINMIIGFLNKVIQAAADTVNMVIGALNQLSFTIPAWVPLLGGNRFGFDLKQVTAPQIPYLAKGAVLPANKPFMAVVGDQRHGTNVEAPLATIQEALQTVLEGELGGVMAGFRAVTERQERILEAILGIELSDAAISGAVDRYKQKMAVVTGGQW